MKITAITLVLISILTGCTDMIPARPCYNVTESLVNNSGKDVTIHSFYDASTSDTVKLVPVKDILIKNSDSIGTIKKYCPDGGYLRNSFVELIGHDSIIFDYGDRVQSYSRRYGHEARNPFVLDAQTHDKFVYKLTPEDYANATPKK